MALNDRRADHFAVQNNGERRANVFGRVITELAATRRVEAEVDRRTPVLVETGLGICQVLASHHRRGVEHIEKPRLVHRRIDHLARPRHLRRIAGLAHDIVEGQLGGGADQFFQFAGRPDPRHLDQNAPGALLLDRRFAGADLVDPAPDDLEALLDGAPVGGPRFGLGKRHDQIGPLRPHLDIHRPDPGQADHRSRQVAHRRQGNRHLLGLRYPHR